MVIKKMTKKKPVLKKSVSKRNVSRTSSPTVSNEGFFQRMKEIIKNEIPKTQKVRVKTFIVEKPVIIHDKVQRIDSDSNEVFDSKKSRYGRTSIATGMGLVKNKKKSFDEDLAEEENYDSSDGLESDEDNYSQGDEEEFGDEDSNLAEGEEYPVEEPLQKHVRSRGMFNNIWWKKALFWSILIWLASLAISMAMQAMKLIIVDLTRQWWVLLGIIILIGMVYFKFIDGKFSF